MFNRIKDVIKDIGVSDVFIILGLAVLIYLIVAFLKKNNAKSLLAIFTIALLVSGVLLVISDADKKIFILLPFFFILVISSLFSVEIKRMIWSRDSGVKGQEYSETGDKSEKSITEIIKALQNMSKKDIGAIIILVKGSVPNSIIESGTLIGADISAELIESVFFPKTPLHDGAMLVKGNRILAAGCFLPLSQEVNIPQELGTRHRAGIGITETINVTSLIVSEETGIISIAQGGKIKRYADSEVLRKTLVEYYKQFEAKQKGEGYESIGGKV